MVPFKAILLLFSQAPVVIDAVPGPADPVSVCREWMGQFDWQLLSQHGNMYICLNTSVLETHLHVAGMFSNQQQRGFLGNKQDAEFDLHVTVGLVIQKKRCRAASCGTTCQMAGFVSLLLSVTPVNGAHAPGWTGQEVCGTASRYES